MNVKQMTFRISLQKKKNFSLLFFFLDASVYIELHVVVYIVNYIFSTM